MNVYDEQLKRAIGQDLRQHFVVGFHGYELNDDIKALIKEYFVGNIILFKRNVQDPRQVHQLIHHLQSLAKESGHERPLMIGIDQENGKLFLVHPFAWNSENLTYLGLVSAFSTPSAGTQFPGAMALAATGSAQAVQAVTAATAKEMKKVGINWVYSPVADINSEPKNPVIGVRAFGDNTKEVAQYARVVQESLQANKIAASAKHFPGHGDTHVDSHLSLPRIVKNKSSLSEIEFVPFRSLIESEIATIMTAHIALPNVTGDDTPSSLSRKVTHDILRVELGFNGVIVTDCLEMEAVSEIYGSQKGGLMSLQAGADIAMICHTMERQKGAIEMSLEAVSKGELPLLELAKSGKRIAALKDQYAGSWEDVLSRPFDAGVFESLKKEHALLSEEVYQSSTALIQDPRNHLPLSGSVVLLTPVNKSLNRAVDEDEVLLTKDGKIRNTAGAHFISFASSVLKYASAVRHFVYSPNPPSPTPDVLDAIQQSDSVIITTRNSDRATWQVEYLKAILRKFAKSEKKIVVLSSCTPYDLLGVSGDGVEDVAYLASFEYTAPALNAAANVLYGKASATARVPVLRGRVAPVY